MAQQVVVRDGRTVGCLSVGAGDGVSAVEATDRELGLRHYPVQIIGAVVLFQGGIAQMQTGEGKTITAAFIGASSC